MAGEQPWRTVLRTMSTDPRLRAGWVLLPLRAFLGFTFTFAGAQKLANPGFFDASKPGSIQAQLAAAARLSPLHGLVVHLQDKAVAVGVVIALAELAIGIATVLGFFARAAAVGGVIVALALFLTVSFHSSPYYTGSDIVFAFAWLPLVITGAGGVLSLDAWVADAVRRRAGAAPDERDDGREPGPSISSAGGEPTPRRSVISKGALGALVVLGGALVAGLDAGIGRLVGRPSAGPVTLKRPRRTGATSRTTVAGGTPSGRGSSGTTAPGATTPPGQAIGAASDVPVGGSAVFNDPATGDTSLVIQPRAGTFLAFDAICPHQGCTVQYAGSQKLFVCPCHQSEFEANSGAVVSGPAATGLRSIKLTVGQDGQLYVV